MTAKKYLFILPRTAKVNKGHLKIIVFVSECKTSNNTDNFVRNKPCKFPFNFENQTYYTCTYDHSGYMTGFKPWCSVETGLSEQNVNLPKQNYRRFSLA